MRATAGRRLGSCDTEINAASVDGGSVREGAKNVWPANIEDGAHHESLHVAWLWARGMTGLWCRQASVPLSPSDLPELVPTDDCPAFGKAYADLSLEEYRQASSVAKERLWGLNWICKYARNWDRVPLEDMMALDSNPPLIRFDRTATKGRRSIVRRPSDGHSHTDRLSRQQRRPAACVHPSRPQITAHARNQPRWDRQVDAHWNAWYWMIFGRGTGLLCWISAAACTRDF